mgnify:FL=1
MKNRRRRINFSVKKEMQIRIFVKVLLINLIGIVMVSAAFYYYSDIKIEGTYKQFHIHATNFLDYLLPAVVGAGIMGAIFAAALTVFLPHKIAGPLYRMERMLKDEVGGGDLTVRFHPRKGDEGREFADAVNVTVEKLREKMIDIEKRTSELEGLVISITEGGMNGGLTPDAGEKLTELTRELRTSINHFKLK